MLYSEDLHKKHIPKFKKSSFIELAYMIAWGIKAEISLVLNFEDFLSCLRIKVDLS